MKPHAERLHEADRQTLLRSLHSTVEELGESPSAWATFRSELHQALGLSSGKPIDLDADWNDLPPHRSVAGVALDHLSNHLSLLELRRFLFRAVRVVRPGGAIVFVARDPDDQGHERDASTSAPRGALWPGDSLPGSPSEHYRPLRHYLELLRLLPVRAHTPQPLQAPGTSRVSLEKETPEPKTRWLLLRATVEETQAGFHTATDSATDSPELEEDRAERRYGVTSNYRRFDRLEEPEILDDLLYGLSRLRLGAGQRILSLGTNDGRELELLSQIGATDCEVWGIDLSASAIEAARHRFPAHPERFLCADLNRLEELELPRFDAVIALNVLQCTTVHRDQLLAQLKPLLVDDSDRARLLISIPNCHFGSHDILRRPLARSDRRHDRSPVLKDLRFLARHFYRAGFSHIETFGTYDLFLLVRP